MFCQCSAQVFLPSVLPIVVHSGIEDGEATMVGSPTEGSPGLPGGRRTRVHDDGATCSQLVVGRGFIVAATTTTTTTRRRRRRPRRGGDDERPHSRRSPRCPHSRCSPPGSRCSPPGSRCSPPGHSRCGRCSPPGPHSRCSPQAVAAALTKAQNLSASQVPSRCSSPGPHPHTGLPLTDPRGW